MIVRLQLSLKKNELIIGDFKSEKKREFVSSCLNKHYPVMGLRIYRS